jgi:hypothetical protein
VVVSAYPKAALAKAATSSLPVGESGRRASQGDGSAPGSSSREPQPSLSVGSEGSAGKWIRCGLRGSRNEGPVASGESGIERESPWARQ